jgi:hypothetical protein
MRRAVWGGDRGEERHVYVLLGLKKGGAQRRGA